MAAFLFLADDEVLETVFFVDGVHKPYSSSDSPDQIKLVDFIKLDLSVSSNWTRQFHLNRTHWGRREREREIHKKIKC
jgi:hypothetical protein